LRDAVARRNFQDSDETGRPALLTIGKLMSPTCAGSGAPFGQ
jgi:hypothetical protein